MSKPEKVPGGWKWNGHVWQGRLAREKAYAAWNGGETPRQDAVRKSRDTKAKKDPRWPHDMPPSEYLRDNPDGPDADMARKLVGGPRRRSPR